MKYRSKFYFQDWMENDCNIQWLKKLQTKKNATQNKLKIKDLECVEIVDNVLFAFIRKVKITANIIIEINSKDPVA